MRSSRLRVPPSSLAVVTAAALAAGATLLAPTQSRAGDDNKPLSCVIQGETPVKADTEVLDRGSKGTAIAKLTGAKVPLTIRHFPNPLKGRVEISTSKGKGSVRIDGWADKDSFRYFASKDLPVVGANIWITKGQELHLVGASTKGFTTELKILGSTSPVKTVTVPCNGVTIEMPDMPADDMPERARTYQMRADSIDLYDGPGGALVYTLQMEEGTRKVFWSTESRGGYVHVVSRADVTIDAWAKQRDLTWTRHAELMDLAAVAPKPFRERKLAIKDPPAVVVADKELPIHDKPQNRPTPIGYIEVGSRFYPMEKSGEWTNVMPESLAVLPMDGGGFWVRTAGIPGSK